MMGCAGPLLVPVYCIGRWGACKLPSFSLLDTFHGCNASAAISIAQLPLATFRCLRGTVLRPLHDFPLDPDRPTTIGMASLSRAKRSESASVGQRIKPRQPAHRFAAISRNDGTLLSFLVTTEHLGVRILRTSMYHDFVVVGFWQ